MRQVKVLPKKRCFSYHGWRLVRDTGINRYFECKDCGARWIKSIDGGYQPFDIDWVKSVPGEEVVIPESEEWSGPEDGNPPPGTVCEMEINANRWVPVQISTYTHKSVIIDRFDIGREEAISRNAKWVFRPSPTKRDQWVEMALSVTDDVGVGGARAIHDELLKGELPMPEKD